MHLDDAPSRGHDRDVNMQTFVYLHLQETVDNHGEDFIGIVHINSGPKVGTGRIIVLEDAERGLRVRRGDEAL